MKPQFKVAASTPLAMAALLFSFVLSSAAARLHAEDNMPLTLSSSAFEHLGEIPSLHTCEGEDISPPLQWRGVSADARSLVLIVDDPDAPDPDAPRMTWVHWVLYNLPPDATGLPAGTTTRDLPHGTQEGINDWKRRGYGGPCPPIGRHRYFFKLYALDTMLQLGKNPSKADVVTAMQGHIIDQCERIGTYRKRR